MTYDAKIKYGTTTTLLNIFKNLWAPNISHITFIRIRFFIILNAANKINLRNLSLTPICPPPPGPSIVLIIIIIIYIYRRE